MSRALKFFIALAGIGGLSVGSAAAIEVYAFEGGRCINGLRPLTYDEAVGNKDEVCSKIGRYGDWGIFRIDDGGAMGGPGYQCAIHRKFDAVATNTMLCTR